MAKIQGNYGQIINNFGSNLKHVNNRQDILLNGLFSENSDKRLNVTGQGNNVKLDVSKNGAIEVDNVIGNTLVNLIQKPTSLGTSLTYDSVTNTYTSTINATRDISKPISVSNGRAYTFIYKFKCKEDFVCTSSNTGMSFRIDARKLDGTFVKTYTYPKYDITYLANTWYYCVVKFTIDDPNVEVIVPVIRNGVVGVTEMSMKDSMIFEGDCTLNPPNQYIDGIKSSFEENKVTQEMVNAGTEKVENLGKYKAEIKVVGKNLVPSIPLTMRSSDGKPSCNIYGNGYVINYSSSTSSIWDSDIIKVNPNTDYYLSAVVDCTNTVLTGETVRGCNIDVVNINGTYIGGLPTVKTSVKTFSKIKINSGNNEYIKLSYTIRVGMSGSVKYTNIQLEKITGGQLEPTPYQPYKECIQSLYLNEPLYKNNQLCIHNGQLGYWKNRDKIILNGSENWLFISTQTLTNSFLFNIDFVGTKLYQTDSIDSLISDKFKGDFVYNRETEGMFLSPHPRIYIRINKSKLSTQDLAGFKAWLQANPTTVLYELATPIFVPILNNTPKWILECFDECSVNFNSNIPIKSSTFNYTSNVVSVVALEKTQYQQDGINLDNAYRLTVLEISSGGAV